MKNLLSFFLLTAFSFGASAQTFKIQESTRRADFAICQTNHIIILNKFISQANDQAAKLINGISIESAKDVNDSHLRLYRQLLLETLTKKIALQSIKKQLIDKNLAKFYNNPSNYKSELLETDNIKIDLGKAIQTSIDEIKNAKKLNIGKKFLDDLKKDLIKESASLLISKKYRSIAKGLFTKIVIQQAGQAVTNTALKSASMSFASQLFVNVGTGMLLELLTFPLHGYRLPPESEWLNLLEDHPEAIIVPEWMAKAGIYDHPWTTHCNTIQRETKRLEKMLDRALKADNSDFISSVTRIFNRYSRIERDEPSNNSRFNHNPVVIDNTYVHKPYIHPESLGPYWMRH